MLMKFREIFYLGLLLKFVFFTFHSWIKMNKNNTVHEVLHTLMLISHCILGKYKKY